MVPLCNQATLYSSQLVGWTWFHCAIKPLSIAANWLGGHGSTVQSSHSRYQPTGWVDMVPLCNQATLYSSQLVGWTWFHCAIKPLSRYQPTGWVDMVPLCNQATLYISQLVGWTWFHCAIKPLSISANWLGGHGSTVQSSHSLDISQLVGWTWFHCAIKPLSIAANWLGGHGSTVQSSHSLYQPTGWVDMVPLCNQATLYISQLVGWTWFHCAIKPLSRYQPTGWVDMVPLCIQATLYSSQLVGWSWFHCAIKPLSIAANWLGGHGSTVQSSHSL